MLVSCTVSAVPVCSTVWTRAMAQDSASEQCTFKTRQSQGKRPGTGGHPLATAVCADTRARAHTANDKASRTDLDGVNKLPEII